MSLFFKNLRRTAEGGIVGELNDANGHFHQVFYQPDLKKTACSCPFFPKPCRHVRELAEQFSQNLLVFSDVLPENGQDALSFEINISEDKSAFLSNTEPNEKAEAEKAQRLQERFERAAAGMDDLENFLDDLVRRGYAMSVSDGNRIFEVAATRMADASLGTLSRRLRLLNALSPLLPDLESHIAEQAGLLYLAVRTFRKRETLPLSLLSDLQQFLGISIRKEEVWKNGNILQGNWLVLAAQIEQLEGNLDRQRTWLQLSGSMQFAVLQEFSINNIGFPPALPVGKMVSAQLAFYPSAYPQRALSEVQNVGNLFEKKEICAFENFAEMIAEWVKAIAASPFISEIPVAVKNVCLRPNDKGEKFYFLDNQDNMLEVLFFEKNDAWVLLAETEGKENLFFGVFDGKVLKIV